MDLIVKATESLTSVSSFITIPVMMFILSLFIGMKPGKPSTSALNICIGLIGISIIFSFFNEVCTPVVQKLMLMAGKQTPIVDTGWPTLSLFVWSNPVSLLTIPVALVVNMVMLATKTTKTFNIDIWNMWHLAVVSIIIYETIENVWAAAAANIVLAVINLKLADWSQPVMSDLYKRGNVANTHINSLSMLPLAVAGNWLCDRLCRRKPAADVQEGSHRNAKLKKFMSPLVVSVVIGLGMGLASGLGIMGALEFSLKITAVFLVLPKVVSFLQIGFAGMADAMGIFVKKRFNGDRTIYIGVNHIIFSDDDSAIVSSVILIPITVVMAILLNFIDIIPLADLSNIVALIVVINAVSRGRIIRNVVIGIPAILVCLYFSSMMAPLYKTVADRIGYDAGVGDSLWNSSLNGNNYLIIWISDVFAGELYALLILPAAVLVMYLLRWYYQAYTSGIDRI